MIDRNKLVELNLDHWTRMKKRIEELRAEGSPYQKDWDYREFIRLIQMLELGIRVRESLGFPRWAKHALDIGAGRGWCKEPIERMFGCDYLGVEILEGKPENDSVLNMLFEDAPAAWCNRFDVVYQCHVFEHSQDIDLTLSTLKRVMAVDGILMHLTPNLFPDPEPAHCTSLDIGQWIELYRKHGFMPMYADIDRHLISETRMVLVHYGAFPLS